jgi:phosphonate transport system substrate-binding protein
MNRILTRRALFAVGIAAVAASCGSSSTKVAPATTAADAKAAPGTTSAAAKTGTTAAPATTVAKPATTAAPTRTLKVGAIPDAKPEKLVDTNAAMSAYLSAKLGVKVEYVPVNDYAAAVSQFRTGDLDLVWFGGLTGVQARLQTPGAQVLAQRDIDQDFHSVFIVNNETTIAPLASVADLAKLKGLRFTFGSESSTSGRLMPEYFLDQAGIDPKKDFSGPAGFSGSHDKTIDLVAAGTFQAGSVNEQVWKRRSGDGSVDPTKVTAVLTSPGYHDYHWIAGPETDKRFGAGFTKKIAETLLTADADPANGAKALGLLGGKKFVAATPDTYAEIEAIGRKLGLIS